MTKNYVINKLVELKPTLKKEGFTMLDCLVLMLEKIIIATVTLIFYIHYLIHISLLRRMVVLGHLQKLER